MKKALLTVLLLFAVITFLCGPVMAQVTGRCDNCHSMHNSQNGADQNADPYATLLANDCVGCHSHATAITYSLGSSTVPVVFTIAEPSTYLAGGNFHWVSKEGGDAKGHNVYGIAEQDEAITTTEGAPGDVNGCGGTGSCHDTLALETSSGGIVAPSGCQGCHLNVMHHAKDGTGTKYVDNASQGWYRFLSGHQSGNNCGVKGIEHSGWGPSNGTIGGTDHNEYLGVPTAKTGTSSLSNCNVTSFCCGCHGDFHKEQNTLGSWVRHPSDHIIPDSGEYADIAANYDPLSPVARPDNFVGFTVAEVGSGTPSGTVAAGTDMVMCLSCHRPHGSPNDDLLRWDYSNTIAGTGESNTGCFYCHTKKNAN